MGKETILFDVNETILSLDSLRSEFKTVFSDENIADIWFSMLLHNSTVCVLTGVNTNFATLGEITLNDIVSRLKTPLSEKQKRSVLNCFANLQPHKDVKPALRTLRHAGYRTIAFSNSSHTLISTQIRNSGLMNEFSDIISVEKAGTFKPDALAYEFVTELLQQPKSQLRLISTHDWDTHGALSAGLKAAYIDRLNSPYNPLYLRPDIVGRSMPEIIDNIINHQ